MSDLCTCGEPFETCPHLGIFPSYEAKVAHFRVDVPELRAALAELDTLSTRADVKRAIALARIGAEQAARLPAGSDVAAILAFVIAALAKAASLAGL